MRSTLNEASPTACIIDSQSVKSAALDRLDDAGELGENAVAGGVDDPAGMRLDARTEDLVRAVSLSREIVRRQAYQGPSFTALAGIPPDLETEIVGHQPSSAQPTTSAGENSGEFHLRPSVSGHGDTEDPRFSAR